MSITWLDRAIGFVAPAAGVRRLRDRRAFEATLRSYAGADGGRRAAGWSPRGTSANAELAVALPTLRDRMRDLVRNNPHAAKAVSTIVVHAVGSGIMPRAKSGNKHIDHKGSGKPPVCSKIGPNLQGLMLTVTLLRRAISANGALPR